MNLLFMCLDGAKCKFAQLIVQKEAFLHKPNTNTVLPICMKWGEWPPFHGDLHYGLVGAPEKAMAALLLIYVEHSRNPVGANGRNEL